MSQPCGFLSDLLSCPYRQTYQTLVAPPYTCPMCNGGFSDRETMEMIQGPWGCNQMIRSHVGGSHAIPGQWGNAPLITGSWNGPAITSGAVGPMNGFTYDHRLTGSHGSRSMIATAPMIANGPVVCNGYGACDNGFIDDYGWDFDDRRRRRRRRSSSRHKSQYKYRYSSRPETNCTVM
ncbi:Nn.00g051740.m01.CDS01 [Neocucurbitaria sp. VM-36]